MSSTRLSQLRALFSKEDVVGPYGIDYYILPRTDPHKSEYLAPQHERVAYISGFTGSNAYTIIGQTDAYLWTDGRYHYQASTQLVGNWNLMKEGTQGTISPMDWILKNFKPGAYIGFDPHMFSCEEAKELLRVLAICQAIPVQIQKNLIDIIWARQTPIEIKPLLNLTIEEVGMDMEEKVGKVREAYKQKKCDSIIVSDLAEIAWLLNLRGSDIPYNPVFFSVVIITDNLVYFFVDKQKLTDDIRTRLRRIEILPYENIISWLTAYHTDSKGTLDDHKIWVPPTTCYAWASVITESCAHYEASPIELMKAVKNEAELAGMRNAHIRDSAAVLQFFYWLENELNVGNKVTEQMAADKIREFRAKDDKFVSESFEAISAVADHAAFPHYQMTEESGQTAITPDKVYLIDSGAQYRDGTTDVTRTLFFGTPSEDIKKMNTLVLKGHIANARQIFPNQTNATRLDALARSHLWQRGYDFGHGVGHGIGHFLNVHEFPPSIGFRQVNTRNILMKGMVVTIEPGFYSPEKFGIRIENAYELVEATCLETSEGTFLKFRPLTWIPLQKTLISKELFTAKEIEWINDYHKECLEKTGAYLKEKGLDEIYEYLNTCCQPMCLPEI